MSEPPPTRESITQDMSEIIRYNHDAYSIEPITIPALKNAMVGLTDFFFKKSDDENPIPYQYRYENQAEFEALQIPISTALDMVELVVADMKQKYFSLENNQQTIFAPSLAEPITAPRPEPEQKKKFSLFGSKKPTKQVNPNDPYQSAIEQINDTLRIVELWNLVVRWQSGGVAFYDEDEEPDLDSFGYTKYLSNHREIYRFEVEPNLLRVYSQGLKIILANEQKMATEVAVNQMKEMYNTRNDFNMQNQS